MYLSSGITISCVSTVVSLTTHAEMASYEHYIKEHGGLPKETLQQIGETIRNNAAKLFKRSEGDKDENKENEDENTVKRINDYYTIPKEISEEINKEFDFSHLIERDLQLSLPNNVLKVKPELFTTIGKPPHCLELRTVEKRLLDSVDILDPVSKYRSTIWVEVKEKGKPDLKPYEDIIVFVKVYFPFRHHPAQRLQKKLRCAQEVVLLLSHPLTKLRDMIKCECDEYIVTEVSEKPVPIVTPRAKDVYPSGCFFIGATFYNDMRKEGSVDYGSHIANWAAKNYIGMYNVGKMEDTTFADLKVMIGAPGVYIHQGNCEHLVVVSDVRLLVPNDILKSATYPYVISIAYDASIYCDICAVHIAKWLTLDHEKLAYNPAYFCEKCFLSYNYVDGKKCYAFKAYPVMGPVNDSDRCFKQFLHRRQIAYEAKHQVKRPRKNSNLKCLLGEFVLVDAPGMETTTIFPSVSAEYGNTEDPLEITNGSPEEQDIQSGQSS